MSGKPRISLIRLLANSIEFIPKVKDDDSFRDSVSTTIYQNFVRDDSWILCGWRNLGMYHIDIAVVILSGLCDLDGGRILLWNTTFRRLQK